MIETGVYRKEYPIDTVNYNDTFYLSDHYYNDFIYPNPESTGYPIGSIKKCCLTPGAWIYGVAAVGVYSVFDSVWPTYGILTREGDNWIVRDSANFNSYRVISCYDFGIDHYGNHRPQYSYEYYFESPIFVSGDFYVGLLNTITHSKARAFFQEYNDDFPRYMYVESLDGPANQTWYRLSFSGEWVTHDGPDNWTYGGFFPIVEPDRLLCGRVENFRLEERGEDFAQLAWHPSRPFRDLYSGTFQVALGGLGPRPDTTNILTFNDTLATLTGLDSGVWYSTWVRGECCHCGCPMHGDTLIWGPWRGPLQFYLGSRQPGAEGIGAMDLEENFSLSPNPANRWLTVSLGETLHGASLQIINSKGQVVDDRGVSGTQAVLDVSALPAGIYLLRFSTSKSSATRKLVVE